jgi:thioesterase domain-containing protein/acyl carrier protein
LYKTGDTGYWHEDGSIVFTGRADDQVKIRGYRIEPGEIESILKQCAGVDDAAAGVYTDSSGEKQLVAWVVSRAAGIEQELRSALSGILPAYMVPSRFIILDKLPLTNNGKVDRKKLLELELPSVSTKYEAPTDKTERVLANIWQEVLGIKEVGIHDNFFELGGHSIKAMTVVSQIHKELNCEIGLRDIFQYSTVSELSKIIAGRTHSRNQLFNLNKSGKPQTLFCIPPVAGSATVYDKLAALLKNDITCYGIQQRGFDYEEPFDESVEQIAASFIDEILQVHEEEEINLLAYSMGVHVAFEMTKKLELFGRKVKLFLLDMPVSQRYNRMSDEELERWIAMHKIGNSERKRKLLINNLSVLAAYKVNGSVKADIYAFEATQNPVALNMQNWAQFTAGDFYRYNIEASHFTILDAENLPGIAQKIKTHFFSPVYETGISAGI